MWRLILNLGQADEQEFPLGEGTSTIGRSRDNEIHVPHRSLSRVHTRIEVDSEGATVSDLGSKNKTLVDGAVLDGPCRLHGGETLRCGSVTFTFLSESQSRTTLAMPATLRQRRLDVTLLGLDELLGKAGSGPATALHLPKVKGEPRALAKLRILLKVSQLLTSIPSLDDLLEKVLDLTFDILDVDRAAVVMVDEESGELEERMARIRPGSDRGAAVYSEQIVRHVLENGAALFADTHDDSRLGVSPSIVKQSICSAMCAPLKPGEREALGALYVDNVTQPDRFHDEDLEFLAAFANQAALAIENRRLVTELEREAVRRSELLRFFPPATIEQMEQSGTPLSVVETEVTVLFADIAEFTRLSSTMAPKQVVAMLNRYFPVMAEIVFRHGGTLEKYIGDALMAIWGAPFGGPDDADRAVRAAVDMQRALIELNRDRGELPELEIHVGLNTGHVAAGNVGSEKYLQYATIGDATNVASRVCSVAQAGEVLLTKATFQKLQDPGGITALDPVQVKGKERPIEVYRVDWRGSG